MNAPNAYNPVPLTWGDLPDALSRWIESLRCDRFWGMLLDNVKASERVRDAVMKAVVWLEMKGLADHARNLDDAVQAMRQAAFACRNPVMLHGPSHAQYGNEVQARRDAWVAAVEHLRAVIEQVMADVPPATWEGIDG
jgi:hypothetical protein